VISGFQERNKDIRVEVMRGKFLTKEQRKELLLELRQERGRKYADRIRVILLSDEGESFIDIARFLFLDEGTVRNYERRYKKGGMSKLLSDNYQGRCSYLSIEEQRILVEELESKIYVTTRSIIEYVIKEFNVGYSVEGMTTLLHRLGFSYKKPKGVHGKVNSESQKNEYG